MKLKFLNVLKWIKDTFELIKWVVMIALTVSTFAGFKGCTKQKEKADNFITIAKNEIKQRETISGNHAIEKTQWIISKKQLEHKITKEQAKSSRYLNKIKKMTDYVNDLKIENKRLKSYNNTLIESSDSVRTEIKFINCDRFKIKPIEQKNIKIDFVQSGKNLDVFYEYNAEVVTVVYREKNKDQFFIGRWFWPKWVYNSATTINDPNATIENNVNIEFDK